jgi:putative ABC transport system permease protein
MSSRVLFLPSSVETPRSEPGFLRRAVANLALGVELVRGGLAELFAHKLRSMLTLTLLTLGVFSLVVLTSVLDGVMDKIATGFSGMAWDGTVLIHPKQPETSEEAKRFALSPGLRLEDLPRLTSADPRIFGFVPRASQQTTVRIPGGAEKVFVSGVTHEYSALSNRPVGCGRFLTEADGRRRSAVAVAGATLASKLFGGTDPVGRDVVLEGVPYRIVGVLAAGQIFSDENYMDANGFLIPLETYMDRIDPTHALDQLGVKLRRHSDADAVSAMLIARARTAHHGIEDVEAVDLQAEGARVWQNFLQQMRGWRIVLSSLAATVLLVGGVGVLSVMLISFADRRYEIGLRKALGASDFEILVQFLLEAVVLAALGALAGTLGGAALCRALSPVFPYGLVVDPVGLIVAWGVALGLALVFGLYPAVKAARLTPMEAMR